MTTTITIKTNDPGAAAPIIKMALQDGEGSAEPHKVVIKQWQAEDKVDLGNGLLGSMQRLRKEGVKSADLQRAVATLGGVQRRSNAENVVRFGTYVTLGVGAFATALGHPAGLPLLAASAVGYGLELHGDYETYRFNSTPDGVKQAFQPIVKDGKISDADAKRISDATNSIQHGAAVRGAIATTIAMAGVATGNPWLALAGGAAMAYDFSRNAREAWAFTTDVTKTALGAIDAAKAKPAPAEAAPAEQTVAS